MKIAYMTNGFSSNLNNSYEFSRRLTQAGHEVIYISPIDIADRVQQNGFQCIVLGEEIELEQKLQQNWRSANAISNWAKNRKLIQQQRKRMLSAAELSQVLDTVNPEKVLIDIELHYMVIVCLAHAIPCFLISAWFSIFRDQENLPPMHTFLAPPANESQRKNIQTIWDQEYKSKQRRRARYWFKHYLKAPINPKPLSYQSLNTVDLELVAKQMGVDFQAVADFSSWLRPMTFKKLPILVLNILEMDFPHQPDTRLNYVGPMICTHRHDPITSPDSLAEWSSLQRQYQSGKKKQSLMYCSLGTFWKTDKNFLLRIIEVVKQRSDWHLIIGLGGKSKASGFENIPANITLLDWAPQLEILQMADVAITHGGISSINECVFFQVPMLVYSTEHGDQNGCAARVAWHNLGIMGNKKEDDQAMIESHLDTLLNSATIRSNLAEMRSHFVTYKNDDLAIKLIEQSSSTCE